MRQRQKKSIKNIKDYLVPIVTFGLIFLLIYLAFSGGEDTVIDKNSSTQNIEMNNGISIVFEGNETEAFVINKQNKKNIIHSGDSIGSEETLKVKEGSVKFTSKTNTRFSLNKNGEVALQKNGVLQLESSSLWVKSQQKTQVDMRYITAFLGENTVVNLEQNEVSSTIYLLNGSLEVKNLGGVGTFLSPGQKIKISNQDASKDDLDMVILKDKFDDYFKISDWYLQNYTPVIQTIDEGDSSIESASGGLLFSTTGDKEDAEKADIKINYSGLLSFDNIYDEGIVTTANTKVSGKYIDDRIAKIIISNRQAIINPENKTFVLSNVSTAQKENDIIVKVFDATDTIIGKYIYTLYYKSGVQTNNTGGNFAKINTQSYPVNGSDFIISIPSAKDGITYSTENTFYGTVKNPDIASVLINGYKLKTYNGKTFRYHAYEKFETLGEGVNNYEVKYLGSDGKIILKKYVTLNKKSKNISEKKDIISDEAKPE